MVEPGERIDHAKGVESLLARDVDNPVVLRKARRIVEALHDRQRLDQHGKPFAIS
jgi:hypothetical protein